METGIKVTLISEGLALLSQLLRWHGRTTVQAETIDIIPSQPGMTTSKPLDLNGATPEIEPGVTNKATAIPTGCVPCALGHYGTCSGLMNEAVRFARGNDGMASDEVLDRVSMCMNELNAMERVDLRPQMITQLPEWERDLAQRALNESRAIRHELEALTDPVSLENLAGRIQNTQQGIYRTWAKRRISNMSPDEKAAMTARVLAKLESEDGQ